MFIDMIYLKNNYMLVLESCHIEVMEGDVEEGGNPY